MKTNLIATLKDPTPLVVFGLRGILGGLFYWMIRPLAQNNLTTLNTSFLPGPKQEMKVQGRTILDMCYLLGTVQGSTG